MDKMKIVRTFRPTSTNTDSGKLYIEFESVASVDILNRYKRNLPKDSKILLRFPPAIFPRKLALDDMAYQLRKVIEPYHQTDIRYENNDIVVYKRLNRFKRWEKVTVYDLPEVCINPDLLSLPSLNPALGRNRISSTKRNRSNSASSDDSAKATKTSKLSEKPIEDVIVNEEECDEDIVTTTPPVADIGRLTEHHFYSPARPAPVEHSMTTTTPGQASMKQTKLTYKPTQLPIKKNQHQQDFQ